MSQITTSLNQLVAGIVISAVILVMAACQAQPAQPPPDPVTVQLKWVNQAQFAGFYVAQEKGYYAEENLAVTLVEGGPDIDVVEQVASGAADFGITAPEHLIIQRSQDRPVVAIAVIYRRNPLVFIAMSGSGIERPADFLGRTVALAPDARLQFAALLKRLDLNIEQVQFGDYAYDYTPFYEGDVDITFAYATGGLIRMRQAGHQVNTIWPGDYGLHPYADTLITNEPLITGQPQLVTRFLRATLRGWRAAIQAPDMAVEATMNHAREADVEIQTQMMEASLPLIHTGEDQIGWMRPKIWQQMHEMLLEQALLEQPVELDALYTMQFLEEVYGADR